MAQSASRTVEPPAYAPSPAPSEPGLGAVPAGALAFLTGGAVLVLEIIGMRLVAPYVGVTLQTSTAVISVALLAIAAGAWGGGWLADRFAPRRLIAPLLLLAAAASALTVPVVRWSGEWLRGTGPGGVLLLATLTLFAPATLLAAVSPLLVKLRLADLSSTGGVVGRLSGLGTLGAITASVGTGFVLVAALPSTTIVWALAGLLTIAGVLTGAVGAAARRGNGLLLAVLLVMIGSGWVARNAPVPCRTETAYQCAALLRDASRPGGRLLELNAQAHSYVDVTDPRYLDFRYTRYLAAVLDSRAPAGRPLDVLHVGGAALTMPRYVAADRAGSRQQVVEVDERLIRLVRQELPAVPGVRVRAGDGRVEVRRAASGSVDVVVGDAFGTLAVPWHLTTREFVGDVHRVLRPGGTYALNIIDRPARRLVRAEAATLLSVFGTVLVVALPTALDGRAAGNFVLVATDGPVDRVDLRAALDAHGERDARVLDAAGWARGARPLTDDYAPVEQLLHGL
ncbi:fused MFS/spermidine synthase [Micromonospora siamensis]|uniref:Spermidine synthase n=1 Tax=Micromonospora siamensis TaxID=299152 RepID=A0A1C5JCR4_9ACTN|nr:fused MFS/spermidine synthase [Micromonospora siamensis]SCG68367.1 Spermidine synthase [Micromonospora siamensis]